MNSFLKQLQRGRLLTALLALLLTAAIAFFSIGVSAWQSIMSQAIGINQQYTTIAIPSVMDQYGGEDLYREQQRLNGVLETPGYTTAALSTPQLLSVDRRCLLSANVAGQRAMSSGALDHLQYAYEYDLYNDNLTVRVVKCVSVKTDGPPFGWKTYRADFEFKERRTRHSGAALLKVLLWQEPFSQLALEIVCAGAVPLLGYHNAFCRRGPREKDFSAWQL